MLEKIFEISKKLHELEVQGSKLAWVLYTAGYDFGLDENNEEIMNFLKDENNFKIVQDHMKLDLNPEDKRRMELVYRTFESYHKSEEINELSQQIQKKSNELSAVLNTFRYKIDGKEVTSVEISQILSSNDDQEKRKEAYLARNQINKPLVDAGFIELINMRKELAKLNGFDNYVDYSLHYQDLNSELFSTWKVQLQDQLPEMNEKRKEYARKYLGKDEIQPWDGAYISSKIAPSLNKTVDMMSFYEYMKDIFGKFGFNLDEYNITYDVFSRKNKSEWGYNFPIETKVDSRILANVKDKFHEFGVLLHETGHGVHSFINDPELLILNTGISGIITEGIANLFGSLLYDEEFYSTFFTDDLEKARAEFSAYKEWNKLNALRSIPNIMFDQEFYKTEVKNLEEIYDLRWKVYHEYLGTERGDYEAPWAFLIHHTTHPIYLHNYFMGDVTCEMLAEVFNAKHGTKRITEKPFEFGKFLLEEVVKPSGLYPYGELFERISGKPFSLEYLK